MILIVFFLLFSNIFNKKQSFHLKKTIMSFYKEYNIPLNTILNLNNNLTLFYEKFIKKYSTKDEIKYIENPIISVIIPIYNGNKYILRGLLSIEAQTFKNFEIIYIDDKSVDNSTTIIEIIQKIDKRIKLYKNKENKGILYTKSFGVKQANGKYIIIMDQDDIYINKNLFEQLYKISEQNNLDIIQYKHCRYYKKKNILKFEKNLKTPDYNKIIIQPELDDIKFLNNKLLFKGDNYIWDKLIKKNIYLNALNLIGDEILNKKIVHREDHIITFYLYKIASRYMKINLYGYLHIFDSDEQSSFFFYNLRNGGKNLSQEMKENIINDQFEFLKFLYLRTKNTKTEKLICINEMIDLIKYLSFCIEINNKKIRNLVIEVCKMYINLKYINLKKKNKIKNYLKLFIKKNSKYMNDL